MTREERTTHWLAEAEQHLDAAANAITAAVSAAPDYRTASAISRVLDAVERARASIPTHTETPTR